VKDVYRLPHTGALVPPISVLPSFRSLNPLASFRATRFASFALLRLTSGMAVRLPRQPETLRGQMLHQFFSLQRHVHDLRAIRPRVDRDRHLRTSPELAGVPFPSILSPPTFLSPSALWRETFAPNVPSARAESPQSAP
jgi:hypothetical protein